MIAFIHFSQNVKYLHTRHYDSLLHHSSSLLLISNCSSSLFSLLLTPSSNYNSSTPHTHHHPSPAHSSLFTSSAPLLSTSLLPTPTHSSLLLLTFPHPPHSLTPHHPLHPSHITPPHSSPALSSSSNLTPPHPSSLCLLCRLSPLSHQQQQRPVIDLVKPPSQSSQCTHAKLPLITPSHPQPPTPLTPPAGAPAQAVVTTSLHTTRPLGSFPWSVPGVGLGKKWRKKQQQTAFQMPVLCASLHPSTPDGLRFVCSASSRRRWSPAAVEEFASRWCDIIECGSYKQNRKPKIGPRRG